MQTEKIFIGIPVLNRLDFLVRCIDAIDYPAELLVVNNNSVDLDFKRELQRLANEKNFTVVHQERNLGVSASWNLIIRTGFARGHDWIFVGSNDTFLRPGSLKKSVEFDKSNGGGIWHLCGYNFFVVNRDTIERVGWFDENFYPAYKEDQDYHYRCKLARLDAIDIPGATAEHKGSATIRSNPDYAIRNNETHFTWNAHYYRMKWGGDWPNEKFHHPYNNPAHDHRWWPDPGATIAARDWDRIDRIRRNNPQLLVEQAIAADRESKYHSAWQTPSDINEHVPVLRYYAGFCEHITEFVRASISTTALLAAQPRTMVSYQVAPFQTEVLDGIKGQTNLTFLCRNVLDVEISETDMLFVDTFHTYDQLRRELAKHHRKVKRFIILHDIAAFGYTNEVSDGSTRSGLIPALQDFISMHPEWEIERLYWNCNGLAVLRRNRNYTVDSTAIEYALHPDERLEELYRIAWLTPSDICEHIPVLRYYARMCGHVTEFGVRTAVSTTAFLAAQPDRLISYDIHTPPNIDVLQSVRGRTDFVFHQRNVLDVDTEPTDLLFVDTLHTYHQLRQELARHASRVRKFIILHDIATFGYVNEIPDSSCPGGLLPALQEFVTRNPEWQVEQLYWNCNGLAVLRRIPI